MNQGTPAMFNFPKRPKAAEQVAQAISERVFSGELTEGQKLPPERDLSEQFGVSRAVVREAIHTLELAGMLTVKKGAGGGTFISTAYHKPISTSINNLLSGGTITLEHLFEMRLLLEPPAAQRAAESCRPEDIKTLEELLVTAQKYVSDSERLRETNLEFHRQLAALTGNPLLSALCNTVIEILVKSLEGRLSIETSLAVFEYHKQIVAAIKAGRGEEARRLTEADLEQLRVRYRSLGVGGPGEEGAQSD